MALVVLCACGDAEITPTQIMVVVDAEDAAAIDDVHVLILAGMGSDDAWEVRHDRPLAIDETNADFPLEVSLQPRDNDVTRVYEIVVTALAADGSPLATVRAFSGYLEGELLELRLSFDILCMDRTEACGDTETCSEGVCISALIDVDSLPVYSMHPGAGAAGDAAPPPQ